MLTFLLIVATLLAYLLELALGGYPACEAFGLVPSRFMSEGEIAPLWTSLFLHDPEGLGHLGFNMAALAVVGPLVERELGAFKFGALYAVAGALGGLMHVLVNPSATEPLVGCSGSVFGVLVVAGVLRPRLLGFAVAAGGFEIWHAFTGASGNVSFGAHIGGLCGGFLFALALRACGDEALEAA